jgi:hypothetical protein
MATNDFETKFGILADATLTDKLPAIKKYLLGFQVIARDDEDDTERAVGGAAYRIGNRLVYVPVFWLRGRCKGGDVMYLKDEAQWRPFTEIEVNMLESGKNFVMGDAKPTNNADARKGTPYRISTMNLNQLHSKAAGEVRLIPECDIAEMLVVPQQDTEVTLKEQLRVFSPKAAADLATTLMVKPKLANALFMHYTPQQIEDMLTSRLVEKKAAAPREKLTIITSTEDPRVQYLSVADKRRLMNYGIVIKDAREDAAVALIEKTSPCRWSTPSRSGKYEVLRADYGVVELAIFLVDKNSAILVDTENKKRALNVSPTSILINAVKAKDDYTQLPGEPVTDVALRSKVDPEDLGLENTIIYDADTAMSGRLLFKDGGMLRFRANNGMKYTVVLTAKRGKLTPLNGVLYVPDTARVYSLTDLKHENMDVYRSVDGDGVLTSPITLGAMATAGYTSVKVSSDGLRYSVTGTNVSKQFMRYPEALTHMVKRVGLRVKQAGDLLAAAADPTLTTLKRDISFYVKTATADITDEDPSYGDDHTVTKETINSTGGSLDDQAVQRIYEASQKGVREVLDMQVLKELANSSYPLDRVKDSIPVLNKAMDRLGRILFLFYWHNDSFEGRYGKQNMEGIEEALRENIRSLGDLITYLKEKTVSSEEDFGTDERDDDLSKDMI